MGLEGGLFAFLLASCTRLALLGQAGLAGLLGGLMFATRPESLLLLPVFALHVLLVAPEGRTRWLLSFVSPWLALVGTVTLWRLFYYGAWLPNTIAAKSPPDHDLAADHDLPISAAP
jgi:4-amino-4-deoxy-L-arabinose transferase-like glycosyltransferase